MILLSLSNCYRIETINGLQSVISNDFYVFNVWTFWYWGKGYFWKVYENLEKIMVTVFRLRILSSASILLRHDPHPARSVKMARMFHFELKALHSVFVPTKYPIWEMYCKLLFIGYLRAETIFVTGKISSPGTFHYNCNTDDINVDLECSMNGAHFECASNPCGGQKYKCDCFVHRFSLYLKSTDNTQTRLYSSMAMFIDLVFDK